MSQYFRMRLAAMRFAKPATLRILGLAIAIEFTDEKYVEKLGERFNIENFSAPEPDKNTNVNNVNQTNDNKNINK